MNRWKICSALLVLAIAAVCVPQANAQSIPVVAVGSSALFPSAAIAATVGDPARGVSTPLCGTRFWTGSASAIDARASFGVPTEGGTLWVAWDSDASPTIICAYLSVDTIVGQRLFFGQGTGPSGPTNNATLSVPTAACTTAGANKIAYVWDTATSGLPVAVWNALTGGNATLANCSNSTTSAPVHFNIAFTDIRPEDAQFVGNNRTLCTDSNASASFPPDDKSCLGYGAASGIGTAVVSSYSGASAQAVSYSFAGNDPISGTAEPASQTLTVGAESVIPIVNTIDLSSAGFGTLTSGAGPTLTNVTSHTLSAIYSGNAVLTRDVVGGTPGALASNAVYALQREPMSGTYTTFEWQVIRQRDGNNTDSQESGICGPSQLTFGCSYTAACFAQAASTIPTVTCSNPVSTCLGATCGLRTRVIGTGQMVATANNTTFTVGGVAGKTPSVIGYAFWSLGSFGGKAHIKYLKLDGEDGLTTSYGVNNGNFPGVVAGQGTLAIVPAPVAGQCSGYFNGDSGVTISSFACMGYTLPTFDSIQAGNYRAWNILRGTYYGAAALAPSFSPLNVTGFVLGAQDQAAPTNPPATRVPDFLPTAYCTGGAACPTIVHPVTVFRSHYLPSVWIPPLSGTANNGIQSGTTENGGDVAGAVHNTQIEIDFGSIFSNSFTSWVQ